MAQHTSQPITQKKFIDAVSNNLNGTRPKYYWIESNKMKAAAVLYSITLTISSSNITVPVQAFVSSVGRPIERSSETTANQASRNLPYFDGRNVFGLDSNVHFRWRRNSRTHHSPTQFHPGQGQRYVDSHRWRHFTPRPIQRAPNRRTGDCCGTWKVHPFTAVRIHNPIKEGMSVLYGKFDGKPIEYNEDSCQMIRDDDVLLYYEGVTMKLDNVVPVRDYVLLELDGRS